MNSGTDYRAMAAELGAKAGRGTDRLIRDEFASLAQAYLRLAEQADRNAQHDGAPDAAVPSAAESAAQSAAPSDGTADGRADQVGGGS